MKYVMIALLAILALMSLAAGGAKVMQVDQEVQFFAGAGLPVWVMVTQGVLQIVGAILAVIPKFRRFGLNLMALMFVASAILIFMTGDVTFGLVSLIPAALALMVSRQSLATG